MVSKRYWKDLYREQIRVKVCYCYLCGKLIEKEKDFNLDHMIPTSRGGQNYPTNWRATHKSCNAEKGALTPEEYRMWQYLENLRNGGKSK